MRTRRHCFQRFRLQRTLAHPRVSARMRDCIRTQCESHFTLLCGQSTQEWQFKVYSAQNPSRIASRVPRVRSCDFCHVSTSGLGVV